MPKLLLKVLSYWLHIFVQLFFEYFTISTFQIHTQYVHQYRSPFPFVLVHQILFVVFNRSWVSLRRLHWFTNLTSYRTGILFSACFLAFSFPRAQPSTFRCPRRERPETAVWPFHPSSLCLARSVWYFLYFLVFFPMVATSGGWCGTKLDLFWFCTPKIHMFAFHLLNHNPSFHITYVLIITMANLVNYYLYLYIVTV